MLTDHKEHYEALSAYVGRMDPRRRKVDYLDVAPRPIKVQISLVDYFERIKKLKADRWQRHFCEYLQNAVVTRHIKPTFAEFHAQAQAGKTIILSQAFPAWCTGHDPMWRTTLAMYNVSKSQAHSSVVIQILRSKTHRDIFPDKEGHLPAVVSKAGWSTNARLGGSRDGVGDGQVTFNPVGLISGMTGSGFDCFPSETLVHTEYGQIPIGELFVLKYTPKVFAYNHLTNSIELKRILALREKYADELIEFTTRNRSKFRCTPNHRIWSNGAYVAADNLRIGSRLSQMRKAKAQRKSYMPTMLSQQEFGERDINLRPMLGGLRTAPIRSGEGKAQRPQTELLFGEVQCGMERSEQATRSPLRNLSQDDQASLNLSAFLFPEVLSQSSDSLLEAKGLSAMPRSLPAQAAEAGILLPVLRGRSTFAANDGEGQLALLDGNELCEMVSGDEAHHPRSRRSPMRELQRAGKVQDIPMANAAGKQEYDARTSYRSEPREQQPRESSRVMRELSPRPSPLAEDEIVMVRRIRGVSVPVYDLQVEGCGNFFAEEILVHNCLIIDDPYKTPQDAYSDAVAASLKTFWDMGVLPRMSAHSCIAAMFHRYAYDDFGGYLLNTGKFDYVRYASIADGEYVHDETGQRFTDPLGREKGELLSPERFPQGYYDDKRLDIHTWNSMFQGRPSSEEGDFFKVNLIGTATDEEWAQCGLKARGWDHAATSGSGDKSAGAKIGMMPDGTAIIADVFSDQLDTAERVAKQRELAIADGTDTVVVIPKELAASGKDVVYLMEQELQGFTVVARSVTNAQPGSDAKRRRAYNFSVAVNSGKVKFLPGAWTDKVKRLMRNFGAAASGDDEIDALSDAYNYLYEESKRGLVVSFDERHLRVSEGKLPDSWKVYAAVKITPEINAPNSAVVVARAAQNTGLHDSLYILDEYKEYTDKHEQLFTWLTDTLKNYYENTSQATTIWIHKDAETYIPTIHQKLQGYTVSVFNESPLAGIAETNWYLQNGSLTGLVRDPDQMQNPKTSAGLAALRQEAVQWGFTDKGVPSGIGQVWDCIRMICYRFRTMATPLTEEERRERRVAPKFRLDTINAQKEEMSEEEYSRALQTRQVQLRIPSLLNGKKQAVGIGRFKR